MKDAVEIAVQVNGKVRGRITVPASLTRDDAQAYLMNDPQFTHLLGDKALKKLVFVPGRLVNAVVG